MTYRRLLLCLVVLASTIAFANPNPAPIAASSLQGTKADVMWAGIYKTITGNMRYVLDQFGGGKRFADGSKEEQCLRKNLSEWHLEQVGQYMQGRKFSQDAVDIIRRFLHGQDDWCNPDDSGRENEGLVVFRKFQASLTPAASKTLAEEVRSRLKGMDGRPLTPSEVAAVIAAALVTAPLWAVP